MTKSFNSGSRTDVAKANPRLAKSRMGTYLNRDTLTIDPQIVDRFAADGFYLRWIRMTQGVGGQFDVKNVGRRAMMGYIPVMMGEVPEMKFFSLKRDIALPGMEDDYDFKDVVTQGDLMLAKCPIENVEDYRTEVLQESRLRHEAVSREAKSKGLNINESHTEVEGGRRYLPRKNVQFALDQDE